MTDSADPVALGGDNLSYTVAVANNGATAATGVSTATTLSGASVTIVSASSSQGSCSISAPAVTCALGGLAVSASASITVTVSPNATIVNLARTHGCDYILFDRDAPESDLLPTFDW